MYRGLRTSLGTAVATLILTAVFASPSLAADPKVVVEQFSGSDAQGYRDAVKKALGKLKVDVVSDKKLAATEADLGLMQASDAYPAVAKQLGATNFISGSAKGRKPTFTLVVKDDSGKKVGQKTFRGKNARQLQGVLNAQLPGVLGDLLGSSGSSAAAAAPTPEEPAPPPREEKRAEREEKRAEREEKRAERQAAQAERKAERAKPAKDDDEDEQAEKDEDKDADKDDIAQAAAAGGGGAAGWTGLDASLGAFIYAREFKYSERRLGDQQEYKTAPVAPAIAASLEYFFLPYIGLAAGGDYTVGLSSAKDKATFATTAMSFFGGPKGKVDFGPFSVSLLAAYAKQTFKLERSVEVNGNEVRANVPDADYSMVRAVLGAQMDLGVVAVFGSFGYDHVLDMGTFKDAFPNATAAATEGSLGLRVPLPFVLRGLDVRAAFFARSFGIAMNSEPGDENVAGGATDRYMGGLLSVGYRTP